jgi:hypothetical protein
VPLKARERWPGCRDGACGTPPAARPRIFRVVPRRRSGRLVRRGRSRSGRGAFLGAFRTLSALAGPGERAALIAAIFTVNYLALGIPALIAGAAVTRYGLHHTALVYLGVTPALAAAAAGSMMVRNHSAGVET